MRDALFADILKFYDNLNEIKFKLNNQEYIFYYKYLTILEHARINSRCIKQNVLVKDDGSKEIKEEKQDHLFPIYVILEKALDKDGNKIFSLTDKEAFNMISKMPFELTSYIAAQMSVDITGNLQGITNG